MQGCEITLYAAFWSIRKARNGLVFNNVTPVAFEVGELIKVRMEIWIKAKHGWQYGSKLSIKKLSYSNQHLALVAFALALFSFSVFDHLTFLSLDVFVFISYPRSTPFENFNITLLLPRKKKHRSI